MWERVRVRGVILILHKLFAKNKAYSQKEWAFLF
jgi:hypothetical protein